MERKDMLIGQVDGRLQAVEGQMRELRGSVDSGFARVHERLDELNAAENQRKGIVSVLRTLFSGGLIAGTLEGIRALLAGRHP